MTSFIIKHKRSIQILAAVLIVMSQQYFGYSIWYLVAAGSALGIIFGKVFCRWGCPIGLVMEVMTGSNPDAKMQQMYMYHKVGCPVAWVSGLLNRISIFKIKRNSESCTACGKCDNTCYISTLNTEYSLYKEDKKLPDRSYSCSKCLACVDSCPQKSLTYGV